MDIVRTIKALGDPLRLRVLAAVAQEELTVGEVQEVVASVQSSVSRNLAILREAGFIQDLTFISPRAAICPRRHRNYLNLYASGLEICRKPKAIALDLKTAAVGA
jgi:DNA-binding transcriptional ArsR family regulator